MKVNKGGLCDVLKYILYYDAKKAKRFILTEGMGFQTHFIEYIDLPD